MIYLISAHTAQGHKHRAFGWFATDAAAIDAVERDLGSMRERLYDHLVIESVEEGIHGSTEAVQWFEWKGETVGSQVLWVPCRAPDWAEGLCALGGAG